MDNEGSKQSGLMVNFGSFDGQTTKDREREYEQFMARKERLQRTGKVIVFSIATLHILSTLFTAYIDFKLFSFIIQIALGIALYAGVSWVRFLFVVGMGFSIIGGLVLLAQLYRLDFPSWYFGVLIIQMIYSAAAGALLLLHSGVKEFLYSQKNG